MESNLTESANRPPDPPANTCPDCEGKLEPSSVASQYYTGDCLVCRSCSVVCDRNGQPIVYNLKGKQEKIYRSDRGVLLETQLHLALVGFMIEMEQNAGVGAREGDDTAYRESTEKLRKQIRGDG